jgi:hypothetical protein
MSTNPLHDARVAHGISLQAIASATRLSPRIISALDDGRFTDIPAGIYARAYVRAFAKAVDLDADATLATLGDRLPVPVELSPVILEQVRPRTVTPAGAVRIVQDAAVDIAFLFSTSALLIGVVSEYCGVPSRALLRFAPGPIVGLCAPVWVLYELLLGRLCAQRIFWSGSSFLIPWSIGMLSVCGVRPRPFINRFSSCFNSASFAAAAGSLIRLTRSPGSFFRS